MDLFPKIVCKMQKKISPEKPKLFCTNPDIHIYANLNLQYMLQEQHTLFTRQITFVQSRQCDNKAAAL